MMMILRKEARIKEREAIQALMRRERLKIQKVVKMIKEKAVVQVVQMNSVKEVNNLI